MSGSPTRRRRGKGKKKVGYHMFTKPAYYNIRAPPSDIFPTEETFDSRLRIHAKGHPHHKEPRPQHARPDPNVVVARRIQKQKFDDFLDFIVHHQKYFVKRIKQSLAVKYPGNELVFTYGDHIAMGMLQRYFDQVSLKPDEYHVEMFEPVVQFLDGVLEEILELPLPIHNDKEVPREEVAPMPGNIWREKQRAKGAWGEAVNVKMAARGKTLKQLLRKKRIYRLASAGEEITEDNADFIVRNLGLRTNDPQIIAKLKPTEEEEEEMRRIGQEGGRRRRKQTRKA